jgi:hypothetical protein
MCTVAKPQQCIPDDSSWYLSWSGGQGVGVLYCISCCGHPEGRRWLGSGENSEPTMAGTLASCKRDHI